FSSLAKELITLRPDVILGNATPATSALLRESATIPVIFANVSDPIGEGFVSSFARPGKNTTGFTNIDTSMIGKSLSLLKELVPRISQTSLMFNPDTTPGRGSFFVRPFEEAAKSLNIAPIVAQDRRPAEIERELAQLASGPNGALMIVGEAFT